MKKTKRQDSHKKLVLAQETIRQLQPLNHEQLKNVAGGTSTHSLQCAL